MSKGLTLDAGALIALERKTRTIFVLLENARRHGWPVVVPAGVLGQVWRDGRRQARLARFLGTPEVNIETLDDRRAREAGQLCGATNTADVIDASVVLGARARGDMIVTSDPDDLRRLDPRIELIEV